MGEAEGLRNRLAAWARAQRAGWHLLLFGCGSLLGTVGPCCGQSAPPTQQWPGFARILWTFGSPDAEQWQAMRALGFEGRSLHRSGAPALEDVGGYIDQAVGKGWLELRDAEFRAARDAYEKTRATTALRRPAGLHSTMAQDEAIARLEAVLARHRDRTWSISLGDEVSVTRHSNPLDFDHSPGELAAFRKFLQRRFASIEGLNRAWRANFGSFEEVVPSTADRIRRRERVSERMPANLRPWAEHREFMAISLADAVTMLRERTSALAPGVPAGLTGLQTPSAYGGHDYRRLMPLFDFYEVYDIGGARDLAMSLAPAGARQVETLFAPPEGTPDLLRARLSDVLAHGMSGVIVWSSRDLFPAESAKPTAKSRARRYRNLLRDAFVEFAPVERAFAGARLERSPIWIVDSMASVRLHWMLDSAGDGDTWINRLSSYEAQHSTSQAERLSWIRLLEDLGYQPELVPAENLAKRLSGERPALVVLPAQIAMADEAVSAIRGFVARGGHVVADFALAEYDEHLIRRPVGALDALFGVRSRGVERTDQLLVLGGKVRAAARLPSGAALAERTTTAAAGALGAAVTTPEGSGTTHIEHTYERGKAVFLNVAVCEYERARLDPKRIATAADLRRRVRRVLAEADLPPPVGVVGQGVPTCIERMILTGRDGQRLLAVRFNALASPKLLAQLAGRGAHRLELLFPRSVRLRDLLHGVDLGEGTRFTVDLDAWAGGFFQVR